MDSTSAYPYCHGTNIADPAFGSQRSCDEFVAPVQELGPHVAALGMRFYTGDMFPEELPQSNLHRRTRIMESQQQDRLPRHPGAPKWQQGGQLMSHSQKAGYRANRTGEDQSNVLVMPDGSLLVYRTTRPVSSIASAIQTDLAL